MQADTLIQKLKSQFPDADIKASDMTGGGDHWQVQIKCKSFQGKSMIEQHQMVYKALGDWMKKEIHALSLKTEALD